MSHLIKRCLGIALYGAIVCTMPVLSQAGHHFETKLAQEHPEYDMTDVYVFRSTEPGKTVVVMNMNPQTAAGKAGFGTSGLYSFHAGFDRDLKSGRTITFKFDGEKMHLGWIDSANPQLGTQGDVKSSGAIGETVNCPSGIRWWVGPIHETFAGNGLGLGAFKEAVGKGEFKPELFNNGDKANALFEGKFVSSIVIEIPNKYLGSKIYYYATSAWYDHDHWHQVNRIAHVLLPHLYLETPEHNKAENEGRPVTDGERRQWVLATVEKFHRVAGHTDAKARAEKIADVIMPDVVPYIIGTEAHYGVAWLNGRKLSDDAMDTAVELLTGRFIEDYIHPTGNYQHAFPYVLPALAVASGGGNAQINRAKFDEQGRVHLPELYRHWVHVGTRVQTDGINIIDGKEIDGPEILNAYVEPSAFEFFKANGYWADGSQMVKEFSNVLKGKDYDPKALTSDEATGKAIYEDDFKGLSVMVRDKARFPEEDGYWGYFGFAHHPKPYPMVKSVAPRAQCAACHNKLAKDLDYVFSRNHLVLKKILEDREKNGASK